MNWDYIATIVITFQYTLLLITYNLGEKSIIFAVFLLLSRPLSFYGKLYYPGDIVFLYLYTKLDHQLTKPCPWAMGSFLFERDKW